MEEQRLAARAALGYTAASLDPSVSAEARLLAVVCTLRVRRSGVSSLPRGLVRALRLAAPWDAVQELLEVGWLRDVRVLGDSPAVFLPELVGRPWRLRAGHWALRTLGDRRVAALGVPLRLVALTVAAWRTGPEAAVVLDAESAARGCGLSVAAFGEALDEVGGAGVLSRWLPAPAGLIVAHVPPGAG
ncbi:hypothetical protein [Kitasatospora sp. NPDC089509]|uniref:hypothetical protein n=1 Tax=Kitasatospora sp. NPDC089509 TaxID=3364079 RepID=UPI0038075D88